MKAKKIPERMCIGCGEMKEKRELIRIVKNDEGFFLDAGGRMNGRGAYICRKRTCFETMMKKRGLDRAFKVKVDDAVYRAVMEAFTDIDE